MQEEGKKKFSWDWKFVVPASIVWMSALFISAIDFIFIQELKLKFPFLLIGMIFFIFGVIIRLYCRKTLKEQFSYRLQLLDTHKLIQTGLYKYIRHPAYTGDISAQLGITFALNSISGFMIMLFIIPCFIYRISIEEKLLISRFKEEYIEYQKKTKKLIPFVY